MNSSNIWRLTSLMRTGSASQNKTKVALNEKRRFLQRRFTTLDESAPYEGILCKHSNKTT